MNRVTKDKLGEYVALEFLDHCIVNLQEEDEPIKVEIVGRISKVTRAKVCVDHWTPITACSSTRDGNVERTVVVQSCITKVVYLKPVLEAAE